MRFALLLAAAVSGHAAAGNYDAALAGMCEKIANKPDATHQGLIAAKKYCDGIAPASTAGRINGRIAEKEQEALESIQLPETPKPANDAIPTREQLIARAKKSAQDQIAGCEQRIEMANAAIARERSVAAVSGYEDAAKLHWLGNEIVSCREAQGAARRRLAALKANPDAAIEPATPRPVIMNGGRVRPE